MFTCPRCIVRYNLHTPFIFLQLRHYSPRFDISVRKITYFGCGHIQQKAPFPVRSTVVKLLRARPSSVVGDHTRNSRAAIFFFFPRARALALQSPVPFLLNLHPGYHQPIFTYIFLYHHGYVCLFLFIFIYPLPSSFTLGSTPLLHSYWHFTALLTLFLILIFFFFFSFAQFYSLLLYFKS